jgi:hypothetical protein
MDPKETTYELARGARGFESGQAHVEAGKKLLKAERSGKGAGGVSKGVCNRSGLHDRAAGHAANQGVAGAEAEGTGSPRAKSR